MNGFYNCFAKLYHLKKMIAFRNIPFVCEHILNVICLYLGQSVWPWTTMWPWYAMGVYNDMGYKRHNQQMITLDHTLREPFLHSPNKNVWGHQPCCWRKHWLWFLEFLFLVIFKHYEESLMNTFALRFTFAWEHIYQSPGYICIMCKWWQS